MTSLNRSFGRIIKVLLVLAMLAVAVPFGGAENPQLNSAICYSCFWRDPAFQSDLIKFYTSYQSTDPLVMADVEYILWRASGTPRCGVLEKYGQIAMSDPDLSRRLMANAIAGFGAEECGEDGSKYLLQAAKLARRTGRLAESQLLRALGQDRFKPIFADTKIETSITVPAGATTMVLGASRIEVKRGTRVGTQVERAARDWLSYQLRWPLTAKPLSKDAIIWYHEGAFLRQIMEATPLKVLPLAGSVVAQRDGKWYAPDENGTFRFEVLEDKMQYPTTHVHGRFGWIEDTHGISALVSQALQRRVQLLVGCGDSEGKAEAAFYLAQRGVNVVFPGDRFAYLLLGYRGSGTLMGTAPVHQRGRTTTIGAQPVQFSLQETFVVQDSKQPYPYGYYDAGARYFRRLSQFVPLKLDFVEIDGPDQIDRVLIRAEELGASAVAVRVATRAEDAALRQWLESSPQHRAILFHSGLYPFAQPLFTDFPKQVTFGDLRPILGRVPIS